jgi:hypothetical protein
MEELEEKTNAQERLVQACRDGDVEAVRTLLESGNVDVNGVDAGDRVRSLFVYPTKPPLVALC